jgi:predicted nucleic-acid-binding protein
MIGLDTNVIVRYIMQDDPKQSPKATKVVESLTPQEPGFVSIVSIVELYWVLTSCYNLTRQEAGQALNALLRIKEIVVENAEQVLKALRVFEHGKADFPDCLIERSCATGGCEKTVTFDAGAAKNAGMVFL